ncbi:hypothetical protein [Cupriavidus taiwanensis]|nr:hypothetical protein [Cupriavidus taiwanensis]
MFTQPMAEMGLSTGRQPGCHGVHCLLAMIKMQVDQIAEALHPEAESL